MAVTRINNNQITDANANVYFGINAAAKLQNYSVTSTKLANSLVYGSDLTVSGNLTVNGTTTTIDTVNTLIEDPIVTLADGQTSGTPVVDIGLLGLRGSQLSSFIGWNEGNTEFAVVLSNTIQSNTTVSINEYANFHANSVLVGGNLSVAGNITGAFNLTGNLTAGNLFTPGVVSSTGNVTGGNINTAGVVSATGNIRGANINTAGLVTAVGNVIGGNLTTGGQVSASGDISGNNLYGQGVVSTVGNVTGGNINTAGLVSATGNIYGGNVSTAGNVTAAYFIGNIQGNIDAAGANTQIQFNTTGDILGANANFTYDYATNLMTVNGGNIKTGNLSATGQIVSDANITGGNLLTAGLVSATGNITSANTVNTASLSLSGNVISNLNVTANIAGGNISTPGLITATGNVTGGNINTAGVVTATGNVTGGNILTAGLISAAGNITSATNVNTPNVHATGNLELFGGNILISPSSGNIVVNNTYINGVAQPAQDNDVATKIYVDNLVSTQIAYHEPVVVATTTTLAATTGGTITYNNGANGVGATISTTGSFNLIDTANVQTANTRILVKNEGNAALNGVYYWANSTTIVRTLDADTYGPNSADSLSVNDYFFVQSGNVNKGSAWVVNSPQGVITFGTSNITFAQFSSSQTYTAGNGISLYGTVISTVYDNSTIGVNGSNQLYIPANAPLVTPNIGAATGTSLSVTGAITAGTDLSAVANVVTGNVLATGYTSTTGNVTGGNILTAGIVSATGNISTAANLIVSGYETVTGNITGGNILTAGLISAAGNATAGNILTGGLLSVTGNINSAGNINQTGTGNINGYNGYFSNSVTVVANLYTSGNVIATQAGIFYGNSVTGDGALYAGIPGYTILGSNVVTQFAGNVNAYSQINFQNINNGTQASTDFVLTNDAGNDTVGFMNMGIASSTWDGTQNNSLGNAVKANDGYLYVDNGNMVIGTSEPATSLKINVGTHDNTGLVGVFSNTGLAVTGVISANGNVTGGNLLTAGLVSSTGNVTGGNINTAGLINASGNITGGNIIGNTSGQFGNIVISGDNITDTNGIVNINSAAADVNFAVSGTTANLFFIDAGTNTASFGSSTQTTNALVAFNSPTSILLPVGNLAQRPGTGVTGMFRFNTTNNSLEVYNNSEWKEVGSTTFTVIADEQFSGDGSTVAFTLGSTQTTNSCIVSINGIVQIPGTAYSVSGTNPTCVLTFTEAPAPGDIIDVREITTTTTVDALANGSGNAELKGSATAAQFDLTGNIIPTANVTYSLGNSTNRFSNIYLSGSTIVLGNIQLKVAAGNSLGIYQADGTTPANIASTSVDTTQILNGNSNVQVLTSNGNTAVHVNGNKIVSFTASGIENNMGNGVGNIGNSTGYFNTIFAKATSAQYADLAEKYVADAAYAPGTVVSFGGEKEVTKSTKDGDRAVAGVVSTNPSYIMNAALEAEHVAVVAFTGRVPTSVTGTVSKGDLMVSNGDGTARAEADPKAGAIIGKALENFAGGTGVIEVVIGRF